MVDPIELSEFLKLIANDPLLAPSEELDPLPPLEVATIAGLEPNVRLVVPVGNTHAETYGYYVIRQTSS